MSDSVLQPARPLALRGQAPHPLHPVCLGGLRAAGDRSLGAAPLIVERRDSDFVEGLFADLQDDVRREALFALAPAPGADGALRLFPPVQRVFNLAVFEAFCDGPGQPRLDPARIDSSGMVLRRVDGTRKLAWLKAGKRVFGWEAIDETLDPASDRRPPAVKLGHPLLDARAPSLQRVRNAGSVRLAQSPDPVSEDVQPLFLAPPEVNAAARKTFLFGALRVVSDELSESKARPPVYGSDSAERAQLRDQKHLSRYLQPGGPRELPLAGRTVTSADVLAAAAAGPSDQRLARLTGSEFASAAVAELVTLLRQLHQEFDAFGDGTAALALQRALSTLRVERIVGPSVVQSPAWDFLFAAKQVFFDAADKASVTMPSRLLDISPDEHDRIFEATLACLGQQYVKLLPGGGRFDTNRQGEAPHYVVRAFVRLKPEQPGCAGRLLWSAYSAEFTIAPWYESAGVATPVIPLPDLFDREVLRHVKPNVAFSMPPKLARLLQGKPEDLLKGDGDPGDGLGVAWICSYSIPIITICAFILLNILLIVLNLIFWWLPFLKVCIPVPKIKDPAP